MRGLARNQARGAVLVGQLPIRPRFSGLGGLHIPTLSFYNHRETRTPDDRFTKMSDLLNRILMLAIVDLGLGVVASIVAILWGYQTQTDFEKDSVFELIKIFMGGAVVMFVLSALYVYSARQ